MIAIIEGCGSNIASIQFALARLGKPSILTQDINKIKSASHVVLPGVGTAGQAIAQLKKNKLLDVIPQLSQPVLGICLGMQILYEYSYESDIDCLGIFQGKIVSLPQSIDTPVPHIGWNKLNITDYSSPLLQQIQDKSAVYFVHSYIAPINHQTKAITEYGKLFCAAVQNKNFYGVQFHPEKSAHIGEIILKNFLSEE